MKKTLTILIGVALLACQNEKDNVLISGKVANPQAQKAIYLMKIEGQSPVKRDSAFTDAQGNFSMNPTISDADFYILDIYGEQREQIIVTGKPFSITAEGRPNGSLQFTGSEENVILQEFQTLRKGYAEKLGELQQGAVNASDGATQKEFSDKYDALVTEYLAKYKFVLKKAENSYAALGMLGDLDPDKDMADLIKIYDNLKLAYPENGKVKSLGEEMIKIRNTAIGQAAPTINYKDEKGNTVSLNSFKGKYVLLDFWASWCKPCRMENPNVVKMYNKFKGKGFEILSISLDQDASAWKKAIQDDGLIWQHVTDLTYSQQTLATAYNVQAIPMTYLLDQNGVIIAKNLRGKLLEDKLVELLQM
jgi:peroxiredoxin